MWVVKRIEGSRVESWPLLMVGNAIFEVKVWSCLSLGAGWLRKGALAASSLRYILYD